MWRNCVFTILFQSVTSTKISKTRLCGETPSKIWNVNQLHHNCFRMFRHLVNVFIKQHYFIDTMYYPIYRKPKFKTVKKTDLFINHLLSVQVLLYMYVVIIRFLCLICLLIVRVFLKRYYCERYYQHKVKTNEVESQEVHSGL